MEDPPERLTPRHPLLRHPLLRSPRNLSAAALDEAARELAPLARLAETHGVKRTLEPHLRSILTTPERAADLCARVDSPALRVTFDVTNFYDFAALVDPADTIERCRTALTPWCGLVHLKEIALANGFHLHAGLAPIGQGRTDWSQVLAAAAPGMSEKSWILVEHCANAAEATASIGQAREAATRTGMELT